MLKRLQLYRRKNGYTADLCIPLIIIKVGSSEGVFSQTGTHNCIVLDSSNSTPFRELSLAPVCKSLTRKAFVRGVTNLVLVVCTSVWLSWSDVDYGLARS